jgi:hypothetical protein
MSDDTPTEPVGPADDVEHTRSFDEFETVGPEESSRGSRRVTVISAVAVVVVAVLGGGAYAAYSFLSGGGAQPADVLPASTVAVVSIDLDPSAGQKIAAIKTIRKFPALKKSLGLEADDDLREFVFDKITKEGSCGSLSFDKDVKPWVGKRAAFAAVDLGGKDPVPAVALQVSDQTAARKGFDALVKCTDPKDFAFVVSGDYLVASDSAAHAQAILDKGAKGSLADDATYQRWTGEAGDPGVLSFYVAPKAADYLGNLVDDLGTGILGFDTDSSGGSSLDPAKRALDGFKGLGGTVRFADGGMELAVAGAGIQQIKSLATVGPQLGDLPADTAVALGFGVDKDFAERVLDQAVNAEDPLSDIEHDTGLDLPGDLQTLLGRAVTVSLGGDAPASVGDVESVEDVPAGLVIHGDADAIKAVIAKLEDHFGMHLSDVPVVVETSGDRVALATSGEYADDLLKAGRLGSEDDFRSAVPDADRATGILYVDFNSKWRDSLIHLAAGDELDQADANTAPLRSLGLSTWQDGEVSHALLKIATD